MTRICWISLVTLLLTLALRTLAAVPEQPATFRVHVINMPDSAFVNAFVVETSGHCVVIDAGFSSEDGAAIRRRAEETDKPIAALLLTHAHIDHYGGLVAFRSVDAPLVASAGVARQLEEWDEINHARFGAQPDRPPRRPDRILASGESIELDGVTFSMFDEGPGESYADVWWLISSSAQRAAIIGDLAMYGIPPFMQSGHSADWIRSLKHVKKMLPANTGIYIGHDLEAGAPAKARRDASILDWQIARLEAFRQAVESVTSGRRLLTPAEIEKVVAAMRKDAPENLPPFDFLVSTTANVLAAELISENEKTRFERALQRVLTGSVESKGSGESRGAEVMR